MAIQIHVSPCGCALLTHLKQRTWSQKQRSGWTSQKQRSGQRRGFLRWCQRSMTWRRGSWKHEWHSSKLRRSETRQRTYCEDMCRKIDNQQYNNNSFAHNVIFLIFLLTTDIFWIVPMHCWTHTAAIFNSAIYRQRVLKQWTYTYIKWNLH